MHMVCSSVPLDLFATHNSFFSALADFGELYVLITLSTLNRGFQLGEHWFNSWMLRCAGGAAICAAGKKLLL